MTDPTSRMTAEDWQDIAESEFIDYAESEMNGGSIAFIFDHEELGLHGFRFYEQTGELEPCSFERAD